MKQARVSFLTLRVDELTVHPIVQRVQTNRSKIERMKQELNLDALGTIHVVRYPVNGESRKWVVDGWHRITALQELDLGEVMVNVALHHDIRDDASAARLFLDLGERTPHTAYDKFRNEVTAGDEVAVAAVKTAEKHGLKVSAAHGASSLCCVSALKKLQHVNILDETLAMCHSAFGRTADAHEGKLLEGLGIVMRMNGALDRAALLQKLRKFATGAGGIIGRARTMQVYDKAPLSKLVAKVIINEYNKGRGVGRVEL